MYYFLFDVFLKPQSNTTDTFTPSERAFLYVFRSLWSNLKNLSKCLKSRILTKLSDVVQLLSLYVSIGYFRCTFQSFHCTLGVKNVALLSDKAAKIDMMHSLLPLHRKRLHCILDVSQISLRLTLLFLYGPLLIP